MSDEGDKDAGAGGDTTDTGAGGTADAGGDDEDFKLQTAPFDPRFPNQNQTKHCFTSFLDYHRCIRKRGENYPPCQYFQRVYKSMCPNAWIAKWEDQIEAGKFPASLD